MLGVGAGEPSRRRARADTGSFGCRLLRPAPSGVTGRRAAGAALALVVIALAGCGSSSSSSAPTRAAPSVAADQQVAGHAQLRLTDFPPGWQQSATAQSTSRSPCQSVERAKAATHARGRSHDFSNGRDVPVAYSAIYLYADTRTAEHWFDELSSRATRTCLAEVLARGLASGAGGAANKADEITTSPVALARVGDQRAEARLTIPDNSGGSSGELSADLIFVRVDRGVAILTLLDTVTRFDQTLAAGLTRDVADRLGARLEGTMP